MSIQMSANVDVECRQGSLQMSMEMSRKNSPKKTRIICLKNIESIFDIFIYIYTHTHTHTHTQKGSIFKHFPEEKCTKLGTDPK